MSKTVFLVLGLSLLCAMPILSTFETGENAPARTAQLSTQNTLVAPRAY